MKSHHLKFSKSIAAGGALLGVFLSSVVVAAELDEIMVTARKIEE